MSHGIDATVASIDEGTTPEVSALLRDLDDQPVPGSALDSLQLTYYQEYTQAIINERDMQDVLQVNDVTVDADGKLVWTMRLEDTVILNDALETEPHIAHFTFTYSDGTERTGSLTIRIPVANILRDAS